MTKIVRITQASRMEYANPQDELKHVMEKLRSAGFPVAGISYLIALQSGEMTIRYDAGDLVFTWRSV